MSSMVFHLDIVTMFVYIDQFFFAIVFSFILISSELGCFLHDGWLFPLYLLISSDLSCMKQ